MKINLIIDRLFVYFKVNTHIELAKRLGVSPTTLSNWKSRNTIDYEILFTKCEKVNFDWLFMGRGDMYHENYHQINEPISLGLNENSTEYKTIIEAKEETIRTQKRYITHLETELKKCKTEEPEPAGQKRKAV